MADGGNSRGGAAGDGGVGRLAIGATLREARQGQGLSINGMAEATGLTKGFLSRLERDEVSASVASLLRVCQTLGITMGELFDPPQRSLVARQQGGPITLGGFGAHEQVLSAANEHLLVVHAVIDPEGTSGAEPHLLKADAEFAYVIAGTLHVVVGDEEFVLGPGDALTFPADEPHRWTNRGPDQVEVLWVLALPEG